MKVVSYNLRFGGKTDGGNHWQQIMGEFAPDIICAQESFHPEQYFSGDEFRAHFKGSVWSAASKVKWGSAILSKNHSLEPIVVPGFEGWVVGASISGIVIGGVVQSIQVFSVHAPSPGPYEPSVNQIFDEIFKLRDGSSLIVAGDFNLTTAVRHSSEEIRNSLGERKLFERLRQDFGLVNAWQVIHPNEILPQTLRWSRNPLPNYHCDGIFLSQDCLPNLTDATVEISDQWELLSDHNPITIKLA